MPLNIPTFLTRLGSSVVFVAIMLTGLLWNEWSFLGLVCLVNVLCLREYFRLIPKIARQTYWPAWLGPAMQLVGLAALLYCCSLWAIATTTGHIHGPADKFYLYIVAYANLAWLVLLIPVLPVAFLLAGMISKRAYDRSVLRAVLGLFYITMPMIFLFAMYKTGAYLPLMLICMIWSNDTMAYLVGSFIGKTSLSPVSPKKTWEGTIGGALVTVIAAGVAGWLIGMYPLSSWIALALCATIAGTFGDLLESKLKRMAEVKDSGAMMPGHGGALDRFDSLLLATPFAFMYVVYFMR